MKKECIICGLLESTVSATGTKCMDGLNHNFCREKNETKIKSEGLDELYCEFWRCLSCNEGSIPAGSNYCLNCGKKIVKNI